MQNEACHAYEVSNDELFNQEPYLENAEEESESERGVKVRVRVGVSRNEKGFFILAPIFSSDAGVFFFGLLTFCFFIT